MKKRSKRCVSKPRVVKSGRKYLCVCATRRGSRKLPLSKCRS